VEEAAGPGGVFDGHRNNSTISAEAYFSLMHREDLLETLPAVEVDEMTSAVADALETAAGPGWRLIPVGGGARDIRSHDCDFVVTHDSNKPAEGVVNAVVDKLLERGQLWPGRGKGGDAMMRVQSGRMPGHVDRIKAHVAEKQQAKAPRFSNLAADRFDHLFGMFKTGEGKARRLDLIFVPPEELGFGTLGWIGGKQFLRFMRAYSDDECGMHLNSHRLVAHKDGRVWVVPDEGPPLNRERKAEWPPGWDASRRVKHESDIFELLGVPYHTPNERNCP
jgi:DNA polymerase/3'-5' exonuclease PolX